MALGVHGVGIGLRRPHFDSIFSAESSADWLEIIAENYLAPSARADFVLSRVLERWPVVAHGVALNLGGRTAIDPRYLNLLGRLLDRIGAHVASDHLCFSSDGDWHSFDLLPVPHSEPFVHHVATRIRHARAVLGRPIMIENITAYAVMPGSTLSEGVFLASVLEEADAGLLLDLNNLYINAMNHGVNPESILDELPLERVWQVHLAGHRVEGVGAAMVLIDDHGSAVPDPVWGLYEELLRRVGSVPTLIEWDNEIPAVERLLDEATTARVLMQRRGP